MTKPVKPTPGALRAAQVINAELHLVGPGTDEWIAEIIDRETGAKAMYEALQRLTEKLNLVHNDDRYTGVFQLAMLHGNNYAGPTYETELREAEAALRVARGE